MKPRALLLTMALVMCAGAARAVEREQLVALSASVLKIEAQTTRGTIGLGSGVVVAPERVVTNCHVTRDALTVQVLRGGVRWLAETQLALPEHDLCVLRVPGLRADAVKVGSAEGLMPGTPVVGVGYTGGMGLQLIEGTVFRLHQHAGGKVVQSTNFFNSGASGGGLFDESLNLVGILTFRLRGGESHYFAVPIDWVASALNDPSLEMPVRPLTNAPMAFWQRTAQAQPSFLAAAALEQTSQWPALLRLSTAWTQRESDNGEPWYMRGLALERLQRLPEAQASLEEALRQDPSFLAALHRLGLVLIQRGQIDEALSVLARLRPREPALAQDLQRTIQDHCTRLADAKTASTCPSEST